jgi:NAD(P)-dependent dehydrogenase (short-subunit alcohol dehydrogenase family)
MKTQQVVLITGALTGIGKATAIAFAGEGAQIVVSGRKTEAGLALAAELKKLGRLMYATKKSLKTWSIGP